MADSYYVNLRKVENAMRELHQDVEERNKLASTPGGVTAKKDTVIRNQVKNLQRMVEQLLAEVEMYEKDQDQYNLSSRELGLRRKKAYDLKNDFEEIKKKVSGLHQKKPSRYDSELEREKFGEKYNVDGMNQQETKELTKKLRDEQEEMLDQIGDTVAVIKTGQLAMKEELDYHNKVLLPDIEVGVDRNLAKTQKSNARIVKLLNSKSNCSLYMIIAAEIIVLLVQFIILP